MYAIFQDGGHQYRAETGARLRVEVREVEDGATITFDNVCLVGGEGEARVGTPYVDGVSVEARVTRSDVKAAKIEGHTFKRRKGKHRRWGHRQRYTEIEITAISG